MRLKFGPTGKKKFWRPTFEDGQLFVMVRNNAKNVKVPVDSDEKLIASLQKEIDPNTIIEGYVKLNNNNRLEVLSYSIWTPGSASYIPYSVIT